MRRFLTSTLGMMVVTSWLTALNVQDASAADRKDIEGLISADPLPKGFEVKRQDISDGARVLGNVLLITKEGSPTRSLVQIERREIKERPARVATLKAYVNAAGATWQKQGYAVKVRSLPVVEEIDFSKPVAIDFDATKPGEKPTQMHLEVFFDTFAYQTMAVSTDDAELKNMIAWCKSVKPLTQEKAAPAAK